MSLQYLEFDYSEDGHGHGSFEAMASVPAARVAALHAEVAQVLAWAQQAFPDAHGPLEEGGEWDYLLEGQQEWSAPMTLHYDESGQRLRGELGSAGEPRHTVTLSLSGSAQFCEAFRQAFGL